MDSIGATISCEEASQKSVNIEKMKTDSCPIYIEDRDVLLEYHNGMRWDLHGFSMVYAC